MEKKLMVFTAMVSGDSLLELDAGKAEQEINSKIERWMNDNTEFRIHKSRMHTQLVETRMKNAAFTVTVMVTFKKNA